MDALGYIISRNFALVAVSITHIHQAKNQKIIIGNARKAFKLNNSTLLTFMGNPYKTTFIKRYILQLTEMDSTPSFQSILDDLYNVFNTSQTSLNESIDKIQSMLSKYKREDGYVDTREVEKHLEPDEKILLQDVTSSVLNNHFALSVMSLFGYSPSCGFDLAHMIPIGNQIQDVKREDLPDNQFFFQLLDTSQQNHSELQQELVAKFQPLQENWHTDNENISDILDKARPILFEGICRICPDSEKPNVVFYELSHRTNYEFLEPDIPMGNVMYNYNNSEQ